MRAQRLNQNDIRTSNLPPQLPSQRPPASRPDTAVWTEWHLCGTGWIRGATSTLTAEPPLDRVLTKRIILGRYPDGRVASRIVLVWKSEQTDLISALVEIHGEAPRPRQEAARQRTPAEHERAA